MPPSGGRDAFQWADVKESQRRENYLGHSLMAPVGRWQKGRDLSWYAKGDQGADSVDSARQEREEEIRRIKETEQEALARALGLPVAPKAANVNLIPLGGKEVERAIQETAAGGDEDLDASRGVGFGAFGGMARIAGDDGDEEMDTIGITIGNEIAEPNPRRREMMARPKTDNGDRRRDRRRNVEKRFREHGHPRRHQERKLHRSRSAERGYRREPASHSGSRNGQRTGDERHRHLRRSRSPDDRREAYHRRYDDYDRRR